MHIGLGPKPFILATSVFNYADAFDGDLSAWDVSVVIYSARLKSIVYIGWLIVYSGVCTRSVPLHFTPRIGGRPIWGWVSVSDVALAAVVTVCRWWSLGGIYLLVVGRGPRRSKVAIPPPIFVARAHAIAHIDSTYQFAPRIGGRPTLG